MLGDETFPEWTSAFMEGSSFEGNWEEGSEMRFLDPEGSGMLSEIAENRPHEFISIKHVGILNKGVEDYDSEEAKKWTPAYENYTFKEENGTTTILIDQDVSDEYKLMFEEQWPKALAKLKELCEK